MKSKDYIMHSNLLGADIKVSRSKDSLEHRSYKYIAKVPLGNGKYRYFYTQAEYDFYKRAKKAGEDTKKDIDRLEDFVNAKARQPLNTYRDGEPYSTKSLTEQLQSEGEKDIRSAVKNATTWHTLLRKKKKAKGSGSKKKKKVYDYYWR